MSATKSYEILIKPPGQSFGAPRMLFSPFHLRKRQRQMISECKFVLTHLALFYLPRFQHDAASILLLKHAKTFLLDIIEAGFSCLFYSLVPYTSTVHRLSF
jgi:hypothetical protein